MQILPIFFQPKTYTPQPRMNFRGGLEKDVVNFSKNEFLHLSPKEIWARIKSSKMNPENLIGRGGEAEVWKIEGTDYCVRIQYRFWNDEQDYSNTNLTKQDKVNHVVAKLAKGVTIMPVIKGVAFHTKGIEDKEITQMIEDMPQKAFDDLVLQIYKADKAGMTFDTGAKNIIINPENKTMTAIDFFPHCWCSVDNSILSAIFLCIGKKQAMDAEKQKHFQAKLLKAALNIIQSQPNIEQSKFGFSRFADEVVENKNYARIIKEHLNALSVSEGAEFEGHIKVINALIRQLF